MRGSLVHGVVLLALAGVLVRLSGLLYRVPLTRLIGAEGIGIYQMALPAYGAVLSLAAGGIPIATSHLAADYAARGRPHVGEQVLRLALTAVAVAGALGTLALLLGANRLAAMLGNEKARWPLIALAPAVSFCALETCYRGYFHGRGLMSVSAAALVLEQVLRIATTLAAAYALYPLGLEFAAAGAAVGATAGGLGSLLFFAWRHSRVQVPCPRWDPGEGPGRLTWRMARLAWPVTLGAAVLPLLNLVDVGIIQRGLLRAGHPVAAATALYGHYSGMALPLVTTPSVLIAAACSALVPAVAAAAARRDRDGVADKVILALRVTAIICLPAAVGLLFLARPLCRLIFGEPAAAVPLIWMAPATLLYPMHWVLGSTLQGLGETARPIRNYTICVLVKLALDYTLAPHPLGGIRGVALATVIEYGLCCWLTVRDVERALDRSLPWGRILGPPFLASLVMGLALLAVTWRRTDLAALAAAALFGPGVYAAGLLATGAISWGELRKLKW